MTGRNRTLIISTGLFVMAVVPRIVGLGGFLTIDEIKWIEGAGQFTLALQSGDLAQTYWHFFPGITITWGETLALWLGRLLKGGDLTNYITTQVADPARTIGLFRLPGALLTALFAPGVYLFGRRVWGEWTASLAGALVALNPFLLAHSRIVNGDAGAAGLMLLSVLVFLRLWRGGSLPFQGPAPPGSRGMGRAAVLSGAIGGLALLTKLPAPLIVPFTAVLSIAGWWRDRRTGFWLKALLLWGLAALLIFILLWPAVWVNPLGTLQQMWRDTFDVGEAGEGHSTFYRGQVVDDPGWGFYLYAVAFRLTPVTLAGLLLFILAAVRAGRAGYTARLGWPSWSLLIYVFFIYVFSSLSPKKQDRYVMAVFPALDMLAAIGYAQILNIKRSQRDPVGQTSNVRYQVSKLADWLLIVGVLAVAFVVPYYPYYLSYYNPLLGGVTGAAREVPVGWGEGLEQAASWLNAQPGAENLRVSAWYSDIFFPYFGGERLSFSSSGKDQLTADYVVFYVNQVQRSKPYAALVDYFHSREPSYTFSVRGVPWVWVYRGPGMQISMPDEVKIEGRAELLGVTLPTGPVKTGQSVAVRLFFHVLGQMPDNESWQVSLVSVEDHSQVAVRGRAEPWVADTIKEYDVVIPLPKDLQPGDYALQVSLWDEAGGHQVAQFPIPESTAQLEVMSP